MTLDAQNMASTGPARVRHQLPRPDRRLIHHLILTASANFVTKALGNVVRFLPSMHIGSLYSGKTCDRNRSVVRPGVAGQPNRLTLILSTARPKNRFNQGCVGGTRCQFFLSCWMSGGSLGSSCGPLYTCCITPSSQDIQPAFFGPVVNDPCKWRGDQVRCNEEVAQRLGICELNLRDESVKPK